MSDEENPVTHVSHEEWTKERLAVMVVGASGDLAKKKTYPSLLSLYAGSLLPKDLVIYGFARSNMTDEDLRARLRPFLIEKQDEAIVDKFLARCFYQSGSGYGDVEGWKALDGKLREVEGEKKSNRLFYFAIPPNVFAETGEAIKMNCMAPNGWSRMIVEKPFGRDLDSCKHILHQLGQHFDETNLFRIDHYLGKEMTQNLMVGISNMIPSGQLLAKSYSVSADGSPSYLTPLQIGRHELYEMVPFAAVFGMQEKERNITKAFADYAADLDGIEADQLAYSRTNQHLSAAELSSRKSHASLLLIEELELDAVVLITTPLIVALFMAGMSQFLVGYNLSVMNSMESVVFVGHTTFEWSMAVAVFAVGGPFGAVAAGTIVDSRGRRSGMAIVTYMFLVGGLLQTFAQNMLWITVARFVIGFASGFSSVLVPIYLGELAPPTLRGTLGTLTQFCLVIGIFISDLLAFPFATEHSWRILFAVTVIASIVQLICYPFLIESPRWLLSRDRGSRRARRVITKLRGLRNEHEVDIEVNHFISASHAQACDKHDDHTSSGMALMTMLKDKQIRRLLICSLVLQMAQQLSGINAVFYYSTMFFEGLIDNPLLGTTIVGGVNVLATYVALLLMENSNRRTLILWSAGGMLVSSIALVLCLLGYFTKIASLFFVITYVIFFEIGLGPIPWLIVAEMFEAKYVATAMSISSQLNWACNFIVGLVFPYLQESLGALSFVPFAVVLLMTIIFVIVWLPETKGTTPSELRDDIVRSLSTMLALSGDSTNNEDHSSSVGNPIDVEWRRAMDDLRRQEEEDMQRGTFNYGFQPIEQNPVDAETDWRARVGGDTGI